ncbi:hypothetical protein NQ317_003858 [Molorchus minor]|uniref:Serine-threonine/tyrosine-protein kinase catalytic domain-containing protein n=1 Tax=Molorchus minor TaxID=1323400 RepID=A0ABQ9JD18_9CUCU|nr:hypothetical protein NQ317_003858 [Molorchus minor]
MQWYNSSLNLIGTFNPNVSDDKPDVLGGTLKLKLSAVHWFTADGKPPEDGLLPPAICAVEGLARAFDVECQTAMVILNIIMAISLLVILLGICLYMKRKYDKKVELTTNYMRSLGLAFDINNANDLDKWEISRECVVINRKLGEGAFGTVYGGEANLPEQGWSAVAVKTLKSDRPPKKNSIFSRKPRL